MLITVGGAAVAVAVNVFEESGSWSGLIFTCCVPSVEPRVQVTATSPLAFVVSWVFERLPPPESTVHVTGAPTTGAPLPNTAFALSWFVSA